MSENAFILLFRGINVGGNKIVKMETLRKVLAEAGFGGVATYIQSGNVVLTSDKDEKAVIAGVEKVFDKTFGFSSRPTIRSLKAWRRIVKGNPFVDVAQEGRQLHAVLLDAAPGKEAVATLKSLAASEQIEVKDGVLYLYTPDGFGASEVAKGLDKVLKVPLTARNWNTVLKLQEMAEKLAQG
ncbi:MAG: DUF1697 domain-containing protein [Dehalococcoidia bacterium]|nr:DUF1697 domain-containing protein [Dehalococcoidia bacterium]